MLRLRDEPANSAGETALAELCSIYWYPLYAFALRSGHSQHDAEDLTQGFFARLIDGNLFAKADPARGRLRSFLLGAFKHFMSETWRHAIRQKRGGGRPAIPIHELHARDLENETSATSPSCDPELLYDRVWFDVLLDHALNELEQEYRRRGKGELFERLQEFLAWNRKDARLAEIARELGMTPGAIRVAIVRMRNRFRQFIEREIAETVANPEEAAQELDHLRRALGA